MLHLDHLTADDLPVRFGRYELLSVLGEGGMGRVFRARFESGLGFQKEVALKVLRASVVSADPDVADSVRREARLGAELRHPNLVDIHDAGEQDGVPWLAMELLGASLRERLRAGPLPPPEALALAQGIGAGLSWMHRFQLDDVRGVVHRDLKPANVLLLHGVPKVADYGLATSFLGPNSAGNWSQAVGGTPAYMSPEQGRGEALDGRSDLFALGAITYEMVTGSRYLPGSTLIELVMNLIRVEEFLPRLESLDDAAPGLSDVVRRCLRERPEDRWPDVDTFLAALAELTPRHAVLTSEPTVDAPAPSLETRITPLSDTGWFARLGSDEERALLHRRGGEERLARLIAELDKLAMAAGQAQGDDAGWIVLAMAAPLRRTRRFSELEQLATRSVTDPRLQRRLDWARASARLGLRQDATAEMAALYDPSDPQLAGDVAADLVRWFMGRDRLQGRMWAERALHVFSEQREQARAAQALSWIAMADRMQGLVQRAYTRFEEALATLEETADERQILNAVVNLWPVAAHLGRRHESHELAARAMAMAERVGDGDMLLHAGSNRASMLADTGYLRRAIEAGEQALANSTATNRRLLLWTKGMVGSWRGLLGDPAGRGVAEEAVEELESQGEGPLAGYVELRLLRLERLTSGERGLAELGRLTDVFVRSGDPRGLAWAAVERAWRTLELDDVRDAVQQARQQSVGQTCEALHLEVASRLQAGDEAGAREAADLGIRLATRTEHLLHVALIELQLAGISAADREAIGGRPHRLLRDLGIPADAPVVAL